jgi:phosphoglycerate kinase
MADFKTIDALDLAGKRVLLRVDLNVPLHDGRVGDPTRIQRIVPTIKFLIAAGARIILLSHFGRPKGKRDLSQSLRPLVEPLSAALGGVPVAFAEDCIGPAASSVVDALAPGQVALLENLRFHPGCEANDPAFAAELAALGDVYINDAFSAAHRAHASTEALARLLPRAAGLLMQAELEALSAALDHPQRPLAALVGGSKVSTKLDLLNSLVAKVDILIIGGAMANTLLLAQGVAVGKSLAEAEMLDTARSIFRAADAAGCRIVLPVDAVVAPALKPGVVTSVVAIDAVPEDQMILDIGPDSVTSILAVLASARTLVWNGPVGAFETPPFDRGTTDIAQGVAALVAAGDLMAVAGGGDTVAALAHAGVEERLSYVSTAGGAFLEWLEGRTLPGVAALLET